MQKNQSITEDAAVLMNSRNPSNHLLCRCGVIKRSYIWLEQQQQQKDLHRKKKKKTSSRNKNACICTCLHSYSYFYSRTKIHRTKWVDGERNKLWEQLLRFYHLIVFSRKSPRWFPKTWNISGETECFVQLYPAHMKFTVIAPVRDLINHNCCELYISGKKKKAISFWCK